MAEMFDNRGIAKRALLRAEEIKAEQKHKDIWRKTAMSVGVCAVSVVIVIASFQVGRLSDDYIKIDDERIPIAAFQLPDENAC